MPQFLKRSNTCLLRKLETFQIVQTSKVSSPPKHIKICGVYPLSIRND